MAECISLSTKMLEEKTSDAATRALEMLSEAISISKFSEKLLEMKAQALHMVCTVLMTKPTVFSCSPDFFKLAKILNHLPTYLKHERSFWPVTDFIFG